MGANVAMLSAPARRCRKVAAGFLLRLALLGLVAASSARADETAGAFVDLPNVKLWVTDSGGSGDPVILLHANTGTSENWEKQTPALVQAGYRVIAFDRPGWGTSVVHPGTTPILVSAGAVDLTTPSAAVRLWAKHLKAYDWALIPEAGHAVAWEQPEAFNQAVLAFLRKH